MHRCGKLRYWCDKEVVSRAHCSTVAGFFHRHCDRPIDRSASNIGRLRRLIRLYFSRVPSIGSTWLKSTGTIDFWAHFASVDSFSNKALRSEKGALHKTALPTLQRYGRRTIRNKSRHRTKSNISEIKYNNLQWSVVDSNIRRQLYVCIGASSVTRRRAIH